MGCHFAPHAGGLPVAKHFFRTEDPAGTDATKTEDQVGTDHQARTDATRTEDEVVTED